MQKVEQRRKQAVQDETMPDLPLGQAVVHRYGYSISAVCALVCDAEARVAACLTMCAMLRAKRCALLRSAGVSLSLLLLWSAPLVLAQSMPMGTAQHALGGLVVVRPDHIEDRLQGQRALQLFEGDVLRTEGTSQALIEIQDGVEVALNENTILKLFYRWEKAKGITRILRLQQGEIWVKTGPGPKPLEVETPVATAAGREMEFNLKVQEDGQTTLMVMQGTVEFGTAFNTWTVPSSTVSYAGRGKRCTKPEQIDVKPAIAWLRTLR